MTDKLDEEYVKIWMGGILRPYWFQCYETSKNDYLADPLIKLREILYLHMLVLA